MAAIIQKALHTCSEHEHEEIELYCKTCKKPVCVKCVRNEHKEHDWDSMKNVAKSLRTQTKQRKFEIQSVSKSFIYGVSEMLDFVSSRSEKEVSSNCSALEATRKRLVTYVNTEIDKMKDKCEKNHEAKTQKVKEIRDKLATKESRLNFLIQEMETGASDFTDFDLIEMHNELQQLMSEVQSLSEIPRDLNDKMVYHQGSSDMSNIVSLLGKVEIKQLSMNPVLKREFKCKGPYIRRICPINEDGAWIHGGGSLITLIDSEGNIQKSVDLQNESTDFAIDKNGIIFFAVREGKCIRKTDGADIKEVCSTEPYAPDSICLSHSGDLIIASSRGKDLPDGTWTVQNEMRRVTKTGVMIKHFDLEIDTFKSLLTAIWQVIEIQNGNICFSIVYVNDSGSCSANFSIIHCIDSSGNTLFKYGGINEKILSSSISHDMIGNIFVPDILKKRIHIIDPKGNFIRYLLTEKSFKHEAYFIALFGGTLWIGIDSSDHGVIQVYKCFD